MITVIVKFEYEPELGFYKGCRINGKPVETEREAAEFDIEQVNDGMMGVDEFIGDREVTMEIDE